MSKAKVKEVVATEEVVATVVENTTAKTPGRPGVEGSVRQGRLAEMKARAEANGGVIKRGRPINPESARAKRMASIQAKIEAGIEIKPGRPKVITEPVAEIVTEAVMAE